MSVDVNTQGSKSSSLLVIVLLAVLCVSLVALAAIVFLTMFAGGSASGTLGTGRKIVVYSDSLQLTTQFAQDTATVNTSGQEIIVEPTRLVIDGKAVGEFDENVAEVEVRVSRDGIEFKLDGKPFSITLP